MPAPTRTFDVNLASDLDTRYHEAGQAETAAALLLTHASDDTRDDATSRFDEAREKRRALEDEIAASARTVTVTRLPPQQYARLLAEHAPRDGDEYDRRMGFNTDTFEAPVMGPSVTSVVDVHGTETGETWETIGPALGFASWQEVVVGTIGLNNARDAVPFSLADWRSRQG